MKLITTYPDYILWVDDCEIKKDDYYVFCKDIDGIRISDGRDILRNYPDDEPKKIIAYRPINNAPLLEGVDLLPELPKQEDDVEKLADKWTFETNGMKWSNNDDTAGDNYNSFKEGYKANTNKYSEEDFIRIVTKMREEDDIYSLIDEKLVGTYLKSLSTTALPTEFIPVIERYNVNVAVDGFRYKINKVTIKGKELNQIDGTYK